MANLDEIPLRYDSYFFDFFDTIVFRKVYPEYVKKIWSKEVKLLLGCHSSEKEIYGMRKDLEAFLCRENEKAGEDLEFRYADLLAELYEKLKPDVSETEFQQICTEAEYDIECRLQYVCEDISHLVKKLRERGKKLYCVSDFYMTGETIKKLLAFHGLGDCFDGVYVSSDALRTKRSGRLYDYVLSEIQADPGGCCMIGDNEWADVQSAKQHGLHAFPVVREEQKAFYLMDEREKEGDHVDRRIGQLYRSCERDHYEDMTFALYSYIEKLYFELRRRNARNVFFLSREGEFLKKLFDRYQSDHVPDAAHRIRTHYLMVSRKSTFMASLKSLEEENFEMIFRQYIHISLFDFLSSLGFSEEEQQKIGKQLGVDIREKVENLPGSGVYTALIQNESFRMLYEAKRREQSSNFDSYLRSFGVDFEKEPFYLSDVGWKGTIQDNLFAFFQGEQKIVGLYLGLVAAGKVHPLNEKKGLLFDCVNTEKSKYFEIYDCNRSIFEVLLGASHGSADSYREKDGQIEVSTAQQMEERRLFETLISPVQEKLYAVFGEIDAVLRDRDYNTVELKKVFARIHARFVFMPKKKQMDIFYRIYHFENFGVFEFTKFKSNVRVSFKERVRNFRRVLREKGGFFADSFWWVIALNDAGLAFLIKPYGWYRYHKVCARMKEGVK